MKWLIALVMACSLALPANADAFIPQSSIAPAHVQTFAERHPKLHKWGRKIRKTCQILTPLVSFCGSVAQIVVALK
jgi:hypothetical protein